MNKQVVTARSKGKEMAYSSLMSVDISESKRMVWIAEIGCDENGEYGENITIQTEQIFKNIQTLLEEVGGTLEDLVNLNVFLTDLRDWPAYNQVKLDILKKPYAVSACVKAELLPPNALIEISATAVIDLSSK